MVSDELLSSIVVVGYLILIVYLGWCFIRVLLGDENE